MNLLHRGAAALLIALAAVALPAHARDKIKVVTSLTDFKSITESVGGDKVEVFAIATGFQNPHFVDPKPSYILKLAKADLFVTGGLDLEIGWVPPLLNSARNEKINKGGTGYVDASAGIHLLQVPGTINRAEGDIHIYGNPHFWLDPANGKIIAQNVYDGLVRIDPEDEPYFKANLQKFDGQIDAKIKDWTDRMAPYKGTKVIAYHNEWPYFEQRFGIVITDFLEPKPGIPPTPSQLAKVIREMQADHMKVVITSPYFATDSPDLVARNTGAKVVILGTSVGADESVKSYVDLFDYDVAKLVDALEHVNKGS